MPELFPASKVGPAGVTDRCDRVALDLFTFLSSPGAPRPGVADLPLVTGANVSWPGRPEVGLASKLAELSDF